MAILSMSSGFDLFTPEEVTETIKIDIAVKIIVAKTNVV
jgi:hypothetical protein